MLAGLGFVVWFVREQIGGLGYVLSLFGYTSLLYLLLLARFWWVRDQDGNWSWSTFSTRASVAIGDTWDSVFSQHERSWAGMLEQFRSVLLALGTGLVVLGAPASAIVGALLSLLGLEQQRANFAGFIQTVSFIGTALVVLAVLTWLLKKAQRRTREADAFKQAAIALRGNRSVPFVLDTFDGVTSGAPDELGILLAHLARWKPRRLDSEAAYEASLKRFLQRELPGTKIERQYWLQGRDGRRVGKLDLVIDGVLAIELKRLLRSSEADRAVGQIWKYAEAWMQGPVLLLLCETRLRSSSFHRPRRSAAREGPVIVHRGRWSEIELNRVQVRQGRTGRTGRSSTRARLAILTASRGWRSASAAPLSSSRSISGRV
jgi:hypothetical protein